MALDDLADLDRFRRGDGFPPGWEEDRDWGRVFFAPEDNVFGALVALLHSARDSLFIALRSAEVIAQVQAKLADPAIPVQMTVGDGQLPEGLFPTSSVAATAEAGVQAAVVDSTDVLLGDWTSQLVVIRDPAFVALYQAQLNALHMRALAKAET